MPKSWTGDSQVGVAYIHIYRRHNEKWGRANINLLDTGANAGSIYQDVKMSEASTIWSLSGVVRTMAINVASVEFHLTLEFLGSDGAVLATYDSSSIATAQTESTLTVLNKTAPAGTHYMRVKFVGTHAVGDVGRAYCRGIQLERGTTNTTIEYKEQSTAAFSWSITELTDLWLDSRERQSSYLAIETSQDPSELMANLTDGGWMELDPGVNEFLIDVTGSPTSQQVEITWQDAYHGK